MHGEDGISVHEKAFFLVSTPLHLYNAIVAAMMNPQWESHLFFIDQPEEEKHLYFEALQAWAESPFAGVKLYRTRVKGVLKKWRVRRAAFRSLHEDVGKLSPHRVYVGNDRRIEFAYALHVARMIDPDAVGGYIDDGAYSYIYQKSKWYQDTFLDIGLKKLLYGPWYFRPSVVGASDAVSEAFVALPEFVHKALAKKRLIRLETRKLLDARVKPFIDYLVAPFGLDREAVAALELVVILPHESLILRFPAFKQTVMQSIETAVAEGVRVGVKYHPRQSQPDPLALAALPNVTLLPNTLAFEALLPLLGRAVIVGDVSSALLTARWLRPDLIVLSLRNEADARQEEMAAIFEHVGVMLVAPSQFQAILVQKLDR